MYFHLPDRIKSGSVVGTPGPAPGSPSTAAPGRRRARKKALATPMGPWLARQVQDWLPATLTELSQALVHAGYAADVLTQDLARPLLELGELPAYRVDIYRHWVLRQGGPDLLAELRQHSSHLDSPLPPTRP